MSASIIRPLVQLMISNPGIYICSAAEFPERFIAVYSHGGRLFVMVQGVELDPTGFPDGLELDYAFPPVPDKRKSA